METIKSDLTPRVNCLNLTYSDLGHKEFFIRAPAMSPNYGIENFGKYELTFTLLGYELGESQALSLMSNLTGFLADCYISKQLKVKNGNP